MKSFSFRDRNLTLAVTAVAAMTLFASACGKKQIPTPPPTQPSAAPQASNEPAANPPGFPTATLTAEPSRIEAGQSATLRWSTTNANDITISGGVGTVSASGSQQVSPIDTTTYTLSAVGPNGKTSATATVTLTAPAPPPVQPRPASSSIGTLESRVQSDLKDAFFDYDQVTLRDDAHAVLLADADALKRILNDFPNATINVEGHCDERGSAEYNLGLGDRRASSARDLLVQLGVPEAKLRTISYGKERPQCTEADEACYQKNRRVHLSAGQ
jgi:peptidoglycan-associated lipoprotein